MKYLTSPFFSAHLILVACLADLTSVAAAAPVDGEQPSYITSIHQVAPGNGRHFLIGTGAIVHSSDKALIVLSTNDVDFWEDDQVSLINQEEEMKVWEVYEDFEVPERPSLLVLSPLKNPSAVTPIDINVNQINPGEMLAAVGFEKIGSKRLSSGQLIGEVRKYGVSMLEPRECAGLPHVRSSSFVFDHSANMCVENAATVGTVFVEDASGGPLLVKRERDGRDYLVGLTPSDGPAGVFVNIAEHAGWLRFALGEILDPTEEAYDDEDEDTYEYA